MKPGGRLVYVTCSVLPEENGDQVAGVSREPSASSRRCLGAMHGPPASAASAPSSADGSDATLLLTPARHGTDGFFIAVLRRKE